MPQLVPFYYVNEVVFAFGLIVVILYLLSKYILPRIVRLFISRMFIQKI
jgi:F-type H+-transporting ATPase subunit 8